MLKRALILWCFGIAAATLVAQEKLDYVLLTKIQDEGLNRSQVIQPLIGFPKSWTPGTNGTVTAEVVRVAINAEADFDKYRGKLAGKIALIQPAREVKMLEGRIVWRMDDEMLKEAETMPVPAPRPPPPSGPPRPAGPSLQDKVQQFLLAEGVVATLDRGSDTSVVPMGGMENLSAMTQRTDGRTLFVGPGGPRDENAS